METIILEPHIMALLHQDSSSVNIPIPITKTVGNIKKKKRKKPICQMEGCTKKLGITSFPCKCEKKFCSLHLMPESHACTFDYKKHGRELIRKKNPVVKNAKITQI